MRAWRVCRAARPAPPAPRSDGAEPTPWTYSYHMCRARRDRRSNPTREQQKLDPHLAYSGMFPVPHGPMPCGPIWSSDRWLMCRQMGHVTDGSCDRWVM